jgi:hypothetical protein
MARPVPTPPDKREIGLGLCVQAKMYRVLHTYANVSSNKVGSEIGKRRDGVSVRDTDGGHLDNLPVDQFHPLVRV